MAFTLIGEWLPVEKRARSIGIVTSSGILSTAIGFAIAGYAANLGGWRSYLTWYVLPIALVALFLAFFLVPNRQKKLDAPGHSFSASFKAVMLNKSAAACLVGNMLIAAGAVWSFFAATFWRKQYFLDVQVVAIITIAVTLVYSLGSFIGGRLVNRVGRKRFVVCSWFSRGVLIGSIVLMPDALSALFFSFVATFVGGFSVTGGHSLFLEQAPGSKGTMMSMGGVFASVGVTLGVSFGGLALVFGFVWLGLLLGALCMFSALIILFFAKEPC
jgi:predicted MFS family arabinose efflux permease